MSICTLFFGSNVRVFKPHDGFVASLRKALYGSFGYLVALLPIEMCCTSSTGNFEAVLNSNCSVYSRIVFPVRSIKMCSLIQIYGCVERIVFKLALKLPAPQA